MCGLPTKKYKEKKMKINNFFKKQAKLIVDLIWLRQLCTLTGFCESA